jgi:hypothetical protein
MSRQQCLTCGGEYDTVLPDGMLYFHRCPPLSVAELRELLRSGRVTLSTAQQRQLEAARAADATQPFAEGEASAVDRALASFVIDRPDYRDENIALPSTPDEPTSVKAEGKGIRPVE